jgi:hypothetical protein
MGRVATSWIFTQYQRLERNHGKLWDIIDDLDSQLSGADKRIDELERELAEREAKYRALQQSQFKAAKPKVFPRKDKRTAPPDVGETKPQPRKRGAPVGHPGWSRPKPEHFDEVVDIPPPCVCPHCQGQDLRPSEAIVEHWQEDVEIITRPVATLYRHQTAHCPHCSKDVMETAKGETPGNHIGPVTKSTAIYLHHAIGLSYRKTQQVIKELFGMNFAVASALAFDEKATQKGKPLYEDLREKVRATSYIHADETHWRQDGQNAFVWFAGNEDLALFHIDPSRAGHVAASLLGDAYEGTLITDGYQGYNAVHPKARQSCLAHLIRKSDAVAAELSNLKGKRRHPDAETFCEVIHQLLARACALDHCAPMRSPRQNELLEQVLLGQLENLCAKPFKHQTTETFRKRLIGKEKNQWFTFLHHPDVPPTNNHAEQSIRHMVIFRKTSFGTRSDSGSLRHSILPSLIQTAKRQGNKPRQFIQTLLTTNTAAAQAALYRTPP